MMHPIPNNTEFKDFPLYTASDDETDLTTIVDGLHTFGPGVINFLADAGYGCRPSAPFGPDRHVVIYPSPPSDVLHLAAKLGGFGLRDMRSEEALISAPRTDIGTLALRHGLVAS